MDEEKRYGKWRRWLGFDANLREAITTASEIATKVSAIEADA
jgi:hypothetical protein